MVAITRNSLDYLGLAGYPEAYFGLYLIYKYGVPGVAPDHMKARRYLRRTAHMDHAIAMWLLGLNYQSGRLGFPKNKRHAMYWYRLLAKHWNNNARKGDPVAKDILKYLAKYKFHGNDKITIKKIAR